MASGGVSSGFCFMKTKIGLVIFIIGLLVGYFEMYRKFIINLDGWGDLAGLFTLLAWSIIGLICGIAIQLTWHFYEKYKFRK